MPLDSQSIDDHITKWTERLRHPGALNYRAKWPKCLFHHTSLTNAAAVLNGGVLLSRDHAATLDHDDVAPRNIISSRNDAHHYVRLYFRPKTPTQYHVEGIRREGDFYQGDAATHVPLLYMFVLKAATVLQEPGTHFSDANMQSPATSWGSDLPFFSTIPFEHVYHDGAISGSEVEGIKRARCAEVLATSPLLLDKHLLCVLCRSNAERQTLLHLAADAGADLRSKVRTYSQAGVFQSQYCYVREVDIYNDSVSVTLNARRDGAPVTLGLSIEGQGHTRNLRPVQIDPAKRLKITFRALPQGSYAVKVMIDTQLAYHTMLEINDLPF